MKNCFYVFLALLSVFTTGCKQEMDFNKLPDGLLAEETGGNIEFKVDTTGYKEFLAKKLFEDKEMVFDKIAIRKQKALGSGQEFYMLFLRSNESKITAARYLTKNGTKFYLNDSITDDDLFEQICIACTGDDACGPEAFIDKGERMWGCSKILACPVDDKEPKCISQQTLMVDVE